MFTLLYIKQRPVLFWMREQINIVHPCTVIIAPSWRNCTNYWITLPQYWPAPNRTFSFNVLTDDNATRCNHTRLPLQAFYEVCIQQAVWECVPYVSQSHLLLTKAVPFCWHLHVSHHQLAAVLCEAHLLP